MLVHIHRPLPCHSMPLPELLSAVTSGMQLQYRFARQANSDVDAMFYKLRIKCIRTAALARNFVFPGLLERKKLRDLMKNISGNIGVNITKAYYHI